MDLVYGPFRVPGPWTSPVDHPYFLQVNLTTALNKLLDP